jgi:hypothetical protein
MEAYSHPARVLGFRAVLRGGFLFSATAVHGTFRPPEELNSRAPEGPLCGVNGRCVLKADY